MKTNSVFLYLFIVFSIAFLNSATTREGSYRPRLLERVDLERSIYMLSPQTIISSGKIYTYGNYLFIVEKYKGIHVFDNSNKSAPINLKFINIPGAIDIAIKGSYMYVDNAVDLITLDLSDVNNVQVVSRLRDVFPELLPPDLSYIPAKYNKYNRPENTIIVEWVQN